jgi:hypothetical protein
MSNSNTEEVISVRMPKGAADELRAATGQPFSRLARWVLMALLEKKRAELRAATPRQEGLGEVGEIVNQQFPLV